jgi:hypothetical protein
MGGQTNCGTSGLGFSTEVSICPQGWRLPTGGNGSSGEFYTLYNTGLGGNSANILTTWLGVYSGYYNSGLNYQGSYGYYWSSTANGTNYAYSLYFDGSYVGPSNSNIRSNGFAVRCVL